MSDLVDVADTAFPFDYAKLPAGVVAVGGYVGASAETPHIWSTVEADEARRAVGAWFPIWVPPQGLMTDTTGRVAAAGMIATLPQYQVGKDCPMFLDVERSSADASLSGARDAISAFVFHMREAGYTNAHGYNPITIMGGWIAHYIESKPTHLAAEDAGWQWTNKGDGGLFDLSVFHRDIFAPILSDTNKGDDVLDTADKQWIVDQLAHGQTNVLNRIDALHSGKGGSTDWPVNVHAVYDELVKVSATLSILGEPGGDARALAAAIADSLGPALAAQVATELSKRLAT